MTVRVAMISEHASPLAVLGGEDAGGQNVYVDEVSRGLATLGYAVDVFTRRDDPDLPETVELAPGVRVVHVTAGPATALKKDHFWPHMPEFRDECLRFCERTGTTYSLVHANFWMSGWVACELGPVLGVPVVQIFHALGEVKRRHQGEADTSPADRIDVEKWIVREATLIISQCPAEQEELVGLYGADPGKIVVVPSAVNTAVFRPVDRAEARRALGWPADELTLLYVGRVLPRKGIDNLIRALPLLRGSLPAAFRLVVVGGETADAALEREPEIRRLAGLADDLGVRGLVHFEGHRRSGDLHRYYSAADVFVSTPWYEPYGLTPLEAMACGTPAVVSAVGGMKFTVADGETGFLVSPNDPAQLADRLTTLLTDPPLRARFARAARARVETQFTWSHVVRKVAALYSGLLAAPGRARNAPRRGA